jgi:hypothetical protein
MNQAGLGTNWAQSDWATREWTNLRRVKLEAFLDKMHDCTSYIERTEFLATTGELNTDRVPVSELETIATLYFPELESSVVRFRDGFRAKRGTPLSAVQEIIGTARGSVERDRANEKLRSSLTPEYYRYAAAINKEARDLLVKIMNISA